MIVSDVRDCYQSVGERALETVGCSGELGSFLRALAEAGFELLLARNLESHIRQTYRVLGRVAKERAGTAPDAAARDWMLTFSQSCGEIEIAIDHGEFGWGMFVARKPGKPTR